MATRKRKKAKGRPQRSKIRGKRTRRSKIRGKRTRRSKLRFKLVNAAERLEQQLKSNPFAALGIAGVCVTLCTQQALRALDPKLKPIEPEPRARSPLSFESRWALFQRE